LTYILLLKDKKWVIEAVKYYSTRKN
jgi:hypothetical protein